ncbi:hypothetical protein I3760_01G006800, partial [Carya illinoinensis]
PISSLGSSNRIGRVESFSKVSSRISPSVPLVATVNIMALRAAYLAVRWSTTLTRVGSSSVGRVGAVGMRATLLVATGGRVSSMGAATISGCECRRGGVRRLKGALEQLKTFGFRD